MSCFIHRMTYTYDGSAGVGWCEGCSLVVDLQDTGYVERGSRAAVRHVETPEPGGCRWCGIGERQHASRFTAPVGQHLFVTPTAALLLARLRARRASRRETP